MYMNRFSGLFFIFFPLICCGQSSYELIPASASIVLSINNVSVLQKIPLDELIQYEFMTDLQQELFNGLAKGKTIKDVGINFDQKLNVFYGKTDKYELSGFAFGTQNTDQLFHIFSNFDKKTTPYPQLEHYTSYFNHLIVRGDNALLFRLEALSSQVYRLTDSIWYARGNAFHWNPDLMDELYGFDPPMELPIDNVEEKILQIENEEIRNEQYLLSDSSQWPSPIESEEARDILNGKTYWELSDSVTVALQESYINDLLHELFADNIALYTSDKHFTDHLNTKSDAAFYFDNSRNLKRNIDSWYTQTLLPNLYNELSQLYTDNIIVGDIYLHEQSIHFDFSANYGPQLGAIYEQLSDSKFDKNTLKYIHKDCSSFFTYTINLEKAYQEAYNVLVPMLETEKNTNMTMKLICLELLDELVDKKALFGMYKGSMFGTLNGSKKIQTTQYVFQYDEQTWDYFEEEQQVEKTIPIVTLGFSTKRADIIAKILRRISRVTNQIENKNTYWEFKHAILDTASLYFILQNDLFIITNDETLVSEHIHGYGKNALTKKQQKEVQKNGLLYAQFDGQQLINIAPTLLMGSTPYRQEKINALIQNQAGKLTITSSKTTKKKTDFHLRYSFDGKHENSAKYIVDFVNSLYIISK